MKNVLGNAITLTIFGESHGKAIGGVIDGLPPGLAVDLEYIKSELAERQGASEISTARREPDEVIILSGASLKGERRDAGPAGEENGAGPLAASESIAYTQGTPLAFIIENKDADSSAYDSLANIARPGHADYAAELKYNGFQDKCGGGHFSGRLTAVMVVAGAILRNALEKKGVGIASHIANLNGICDRSFDWKNIAKDFDSLSHRATSSTDACDEMRICGKLPILDEEVATKVIARIKSARESRDSVGGIIETVVTGLEGGIGEPIFGSLEAELASAIFAIGGVKGIEFGAGFDFANMMGSEANDEFRIDIASENAEESTSCNNSRYRKIITTTSNHNGGINGGISNGMPILFRTVIKPTPSIGKSQKTVDYTNMEELEIEIAGRHDPCIAHRAVPVIDCLTALVLADLICQRYGYMWLV